MRGSRLFEERVVSRTLLPTLIAQGASEMDQSKSSKLFLNSTTAFPGCRLEPVVIAVLGQEQATLAFVQTVDDGKLVTYGFLGRNRACDAWVELLKGAHNELERLGITEYVIGCGCPSRQLRRI